MPQRKRGRRWRPTKSTDHGRGHRGERRQRNEKLALAAARHQQHLRCPHGTHHRTRLAMWSKRRGCHYDRIGGSRIPIEEHQRCRRAAGHRCCRSQQRSPFCASCCLSPEGATRVQLDRVLNHSSFGGHPPVLLSPVKQKVDSISLGRWARFICTGGLESGSVAHCLKAGVCTWLW